ncbi:MULTISPECIES: hypothetical protein [unclassified Vibrio]|uniref:hypothetical protein n=1 Tax=unclassified Vibrio TaxID=2614977 RepID=UPI000C83CBAD|nr:MULTISPECIES: hypothetical protein [unclassified Vibrio]NOH94922.1 hypothetical protein [Vibrio sp. AIC-3]PMI25087.1 hypothetical protein BCU50_00915 [Vibrio sp. 10N.286.46.E10]PMI86647.1 hypothetical protein BCU34_07420 [Vibrio sp. 10N.286.45.E10]PTO95714.1 hypothetical protein CWO17_23035 [Vibrio sp. 10N.286.45.A3]PTQ19949.1 hypothetical protein CWO24_22650 [Vibrio sp. 10N.286.46.E10]
MTSDQLLEKALYSSASIHQPHSLKAYLAANYLNGYVAKSDNVWLKTSELIDQTEIEVLGEYSATLKAPKFSEFRIHRILENGVYPAAYAALMQWHENQGFQDIFSHYVSQASQTSEYLSHNVTILLALNRVYRELQPPQVPAFLNRFTEFVTSTRSDGDQSTDANEAVDLDKVSRACFKQFGFFGHNLITLTWLLRCKEELSKEQYDAMLSNLYRQANSPLEDPDDEIDQAILAQCQSSDNSDELYDNVHRLVFGYTSNLHQITLADALCFLHERFPEHAAELKCVAEYQCSLLEQ